MKNKILLVLCISILLLCISNVNAEIMKFEQTPSSDTSNFIKDNNNPNYGVVKIDNNFLWWDTGKKVEYSLTNNTDLCDLTCEAQGGFTTYESTVLFEGIKFLDLKDGDETTIKGSQYYISTSTEQVEVQVPDTYKQVCDPEPNKQGDIMCSDVIDTYKNVTVTRDVWKEYNGEEIPRDISGKWKVIGHKDRYQSVDFIPIAENNIELTPYATWNSSFELGLKAWYNFEETSGSLIDVYKGIYNGSTDDTIPQTIGKNNYGRNFTGNGNINFNVGNYTQLAYNNYTFSAWVNTTSASIYAVYYSNDMSDGYKGIQIQRSNANLLQVLDVGHAGWSASNTTIPTNRYALVTVTVQDRVMKMYINGTIVGGKTFDNDWLFSSPLKIGGDDGNVQGQSANGAMDEVGIWNRSLSAGEVADLYNAGSGIFYVNTPLDTTYPVFSNPLNAIANNSEYRLGNGYQFNITALNTNGSVGISFNGTNYSMSNLSTTFYYDIGNKRAGAYSYYYYGYGNGTSKNYNYSQTYYYTIQKNSTRLNLNGTTPVNFGNTTNATGSNCPSQLTCSLSPSNAVLGVGIWTFNYSTSGNENYTANSTVLNITINKATPTLGLTATTHNPYGTTTDFVGSSCPDGSCNLTYANGVYKAGTFTNYYNFYGNENYTATNTSYSIIIDQATPSLGISKTSVITYGTPTDFAGTGCPSQLSCNLNISNGIYSAGLIWANYSTSGNENYTGYSLLDYITINKATSTLSIYINGQTNNQTVYSPSINVTAISNGGTLGLTRNGVDYTSNNGLLLNYLPGTYIIMANVTGNENYTSVGNTFKSVQYIKMFTWERNYTYDPFVGSILNTSLWSVSNASGTLTQMNNFVEGNESSPGTTGITSNAFPSADKVQNLTIPFFLSSMRGSCSGSCDAGFSELVVFGSQVIKAQWQTNSGTEIRNDTYTLINNGSCPTCFSVSGGYFPSINATDSNITIRSFVYDTGGTIFDYFISYPIVYFYKPMNITINTLNNTAGLPTDEIVLNSSATNYISTLKNATLFIDNIQNQTNTISGYSNTNTFSEHLSNGVHLYYINYCDNDGNCLNSTINTFVIQGIKVNSVTYNSSSVSGNTESYILNVSSVGLATGLNSATFTYNGVSHSPSIITSGQDYLVYYTLSTPTGDAIRVFNWTLSTTGGEIFHSDNYNQTISQIQLDDCSGFGTKIMNLTMRDENSQLIMTKGANTTIEVTLSIYPLNQYKNPLYLISNISKSFNSNNASICINSSIGISYVDALIRYYDSNYVVKQYNVQRYYFSNQTLLQNINLYNLPISDSTTFLITFKDGDYLPVKDALIEITRKYVGEGTFKTVEVPLTDANGQTNGHFDLDAIYTINIIKDGVVLANYDKVTVSCQNPLLQDCKLNLNELSSIPKFSDFKNNLSYSLTFNPGTRIVNFDFTTTSGEVANIVINGTKFDQFSNTSVCSNSMVSSAGNINCIIPSNYGNATVIIRVYKDGSLLTEGTYSFGQNPRDIFGDDAILILLLFCLVIPMLFMPDEKLLLIGCVVSVVLATCLTLLIGRSLIGVVSFLSYFVIMIGLIIWKITRMRDR